MGPRTQYGLDIDSTPDCQIAPHPVSRSLYAKLVSNAQCMAAAVCACRKNDRLECFDQQPTIGLQCCCFDSVTNEAIRQIMSGTVHRTRSRDAEAGEADPSVVLNLL